MQEADETTVLGDFDKAAFDYYGSETLFYRDNGRFMVRTANAGGQAENFQVTHTFGISPLQQYLVELPHGRLQALPFAWDTRAASEGGQRWFHLYPQENIASGDELHWTGRLQNWNYMCAECHSTNLRANYDAASDSFATSWSEIDVSCEACHGPASLHVAEASNGSFSSSKGLQLSLDDHGRASWQMNMQTGIAERTELALLQTRQPEACGRCHSRRGVISSNYEFGKPLADTHRVALLDSELYFDDGQIRDEVYVYGSFVQSRMYRAGVTCSDCHDPHSLQLLSGPGSEPSDVCARCHLAEKFSTATHHHHAQGDVACVDCHMPARDYMVIDPRRDHSFRVPRPDLSLVSNAPNACGNCHAERGSAWAAAAASTWWGTPASHFATAFAAARQGAANPALQAVAGDTGLPGIVRATALARFSTPLAQADAVAIQTGLADPDPMLRMAALRAARYLPPDALLRLATPLLRDAIRSVRIEATLSLATVHEYLSGNSGFAAAANEFRAAQRAVTSQPEGHIALGDFESAMGNPEQAVKHYATALAMDPGFVGSRLNYADALRRFGDEPGAEALLRGGLAHDPSSAELHHALGLLLVRTERAADGLAELRQAAELAPDNPRFAYVFGVALYSLGEIDAALRALHQARQRFSQDFDIAWALVTMSRDSGNIEAARKIVDELAQQWPDNENVSTLRDSLRSP
ncbi:MAG: tetratricopeptide repeat protein [Gammaproteobacteria bacterium]|nr:tetratricopeptide repeat protein [Gammaproteobacteria bacterium]MDH5302513.1 tetratricopeptide repeat protein [Gammaproteobacteria bacterium]MDH5322297.1 tetratricopeptide repeat protein [Gammaproteobacteria bacterium]